MTNDNNMPHRSGDGPYSATNSEGEAPQIGSAAFASPIQLYVVILVTVFLGEAFVMLLLSVLPPLTTGMEAMADALLLTFIASPFLYFLGFQGAASLLVPAEGESTIYVYGVNYEQAKAQSKRFRVELVRADENLLAKIAKQQGKSVAEVTRQLIDLGLAALGQDDEFNRRALALRKAEALRHRLQKRHGGPLKIDVSADLEHIRERHDERIADSGR